jgi:calcineurin-like phosphoesterase family protein
MNIWLTSDTHYFHRKIITYADRPFGDEVHMNDRLYEEHNRLVSPGDTVWHLGDVTFYGIPGWQTLLRSLHGTKHLILGNHDRESQLRPYFQTIQTSRLVFVEGLPIYLAHRPNHNRPLSFQLHGHQHKRLDAILNKKAGLLDVGVDGHQFRPWHLDEVMVLIRQTLHEIETERRCWQMGKLQLK